MRLSFVRIPRDPSPPPPNNTAEKGPLTEKVLLFNSSKEPPEDIEFFEKAQSFDKLVSTCEEKKQAFKHYSLAAKLGHSKAKIRLMELIQSLKQETHTENPIAHYLAAYCRFHGFGCKKNREAALHSVQKSLILGFAEAKDLSDEILTAVLSNSEGILTPFLETIASNYYYASYNLASKALKAKNEKDKEKWNFIIKDFVQNYYKIIHHIDLHKDSKSLMKAAKFLYFGLARIKKDEKLAIKMALLCESKRLLNEDICYILSQYYHKENKFILAYENASMACDIDVNYQPAQEYLVQMCMNGCVFPNEIPDASRAKQFKQFVLEDGNIQVLSKLAKIYKKSATTLMDALCFTTKIYTEGSESAALAILYDFESWPNSPNIVDILPTFVSDYGQHQVYTMFAIYYFFQFQKSFSEKNFSLFCFSLEKAYSFSQEEGHGFLKNCYDLLTKEQKTKFMQFCSKEGRIFKAWDSALN